MVKFFTSVVALAAALYFLVLAALYFLQDNLVFPAPQNVIENLPEPAKYVEVKTPDGLVLRHIRFQDEEGAPKLMFFHGNGSLAAAEIQRGRKLHENGFDVLLVEYRGYGGNPGSPGADALFDDALALYDWYRTDESDWIFLYAHSLGTGVASHVAAQRQVESIVLEAPFATLSEIAADKYPFVPVKALFRHEMDTVGNLAGLDMPIRIIHGVQDQVVPLKFGQKLFDALNPETTDIQVLPNAGHNDLIANGSIDLTLEHFIKSF